MILFPFGLAAFLSGQALAQSWRPAWQLPPWALLLGAAHRFLLATLFGSVFIAPAGCLLGIALLGGIAAIAFYLTRARKMVQQYPWLYERDGPFKWRRLTEPPNRT
ncbi:MAG: hypothetical protein JO267_02240 [Alphaproteobacteria bacterium]|nr:hypothetical protein [Alphaproteobacteria bacterium]